MNASSSPIRRRARRSASESTIRSLTNATVTGLHALGLSVDGGLARNPARRARGRRGVHAPGALAALARPADARRSPDRDARADLDPAAADVLVLVAPVARGRDPSAPARAGVGTRSPSRAARRPRCGRRRRAAPAGTGTTTTATGTRTTTIVRPASGPAGPTGSLAPTRDRNGWLDHSSESVTKRERQRYLTLAPFVVRLDLPCACPVSHSTPWPCCLPAWRRSCSSCSS